MKPMVISQIRRVRIGASGTAIVALLLMATPAWSQRPTTPAKSAEKSDAAKNNEPSKKDEASKKPEPITAIVGADIYTVSREVVRRGTILIQGTKILDVGQDIQIPADATVIKADGKFVTPGFIAISASRLGGNFSSSRSEKTIDSLDPFDRDLKVALGVGITTACVQTGSYFSRFSFSQRGRFLGLDPETKLSDEVENPDFGDPAQDVCGCCGLPILKSDPLEPITPSSTSSVTPTKYAVLKLCFGELEPMLMSETPFYSVSARSITGGLNRHNWRKQIEKTRDYLEAVAKHEKAVKDGKKDRPPRKSVTDEMIQLVKREIYLRTDVDSTEDIREMVALAEELDYKLMLDSVVEAWLIPDVLSEASVPVVITPRQRRSAQPGAEDESGSSAELSGILERSGVPFAVSSLSSSISMVGLAGRDLTSLPLEAAFAIRGGASEKAALEALTIVPAQMMGLEDRIGSIEKGKDADLLIFDGPPLDYRSYVETAFVAGKSRYERAVDRVFPVFNREELR